MITNPSKLKVENAILLVPFNFSYLLKYQSIYILELFTYEILTDCYESETTNIGGGMQDFELQTASIERGTKHIGHQTTNFERRTSNIERESTRNGRGTSSFERETTHISAE